MTTHIPLKKSMTAAASSASLAPTKVFSSMSSTLLASGCCDGMRSNRRRRQSLSQADAKKMMPWAKAGFRDFTGVVVSGGMAYVDPETWRTAVRCRDCRPGRSCRTIAMYRFGLSLAWKSSRLDRTLHYLPHRQVRLSGR